jgi:Lon protease-like protein
MSHSSTAIPASALSELPIFPLPHVVLFPQAMLPLHVFEPRYRAMLKDCLAAHRHIAIAVLKYPSEKDESGQPRILPVAGVGLVVEDQSLPDGRSNILLHGRGRVRLEELPFVPPYRRARAAILDDVVCTTSPEERTALLATVRAFLHDVRQEDATFSFRLPENVETSVLADLCAHHLIAHDLTRQRVLEELDPRERVRIVTMELAQQHGRLLRDRGRASN